MRLTFCGGASEVTGSNYLLESKNGEKILIDCGLSQGGHYAEEENFQPFPYDLKEIQAVLVTHAHIDHVGRIPQLVKLGFRGKIYSTPATCSVPLSTACTRTARASSSPETWAIPRPRSSAIWNPCPNRIMFSWNPLTAPGCTTRRIRGRKT